LALAALRVDRERYEFIATQVTANIAAISPSDSDAAYQHRQD
jgi:hypothetical protein